MTVSRTAAILAAALAGCAHAPRAEVAAPTAGLRCEEAAELVARRARGSALDDLRLFVTAPLGWALTGAGWVAGGAVGVTAGAGGGVLVCSPVIALEGAFDGDGELSGECVGSVAAPVLVFLTREVGQGVYRATRSWRCPDHVQLAREVRAVAGCYAARAGPGDAEVARLHLLQLRDARDVWRCLPRREQRAVEGAMAALPAADAEPGATAGGGAVRVGVDLYLDVE